MGPGPMGPGLMGPGLMGHELMSSGLMGPTRSTWEVAAIAHTQPGRSVSLADEQRRVRDWSLRADGPLGGWALG